MAAGIEKGLIPNEANVAAGIEFIIEESVVDANMVAITDALPEAAIFLDSLIMDDLAGYLDLFGDFYLFFFGYWGWWISDTGWFDIC